MIAQIKMRRGTTAEWAAASPVVLAEGEPGWDSTLKGIKVGDGSTEWAALPWIDAKNRPDINADTLDGVHLADIRLGQNILHNWDFRNPVNQRGVSGAISTGTYFFDRWIRNSGTVTVGAGYLALASGAVIEQRIEGLHLAGAAVCVSVNLEGTVVSGSGVFPVSSGTANVNLPGFGTATLGYNSGYMFVRFSADAERNVTSVKLELGTVSTLHLDPPMDHAVELPKCQRFALSVRGRFSGGQNGTPAHLFVPTPVEMRIVPTYIGPNSINYYAGSGATLYAASDVTISEKTANGLLVGMTAETSLLRMPIAGTVSTFEFFASADL